ncbi:MAG: 4-hydroxy-3-methylbut-2-en-1-yl diphosphate synthase [Bacteroidales bacterium]|nr:4-hydroxy-3-methylbut-2-en-1-yl diphosphate synthase [Bacteroidales bacterium]
MDLYNYKRRLSSEVKIGNIRIGATNPIAIQSMTNTSTLDTDGSVAQIERISDNGADIVRLTAQGTKEAENLRLIKEAIRKDGYNTPLVADIHFNPNVADVAAKIVEKVRINPGNYVDSARVFKKIDYTDEEYKQEIEKIRLRLIPFLNICKENNTAIRIGVNHGSLSDRIMSRYGDTPEGMVESCMEFLRICKAEGFMNVVISIKASNTVVMVHTVRLLVKEMDKENMNFPLHLGVTEAGDSEDGRIKSALGIGALLADGIGDTIRVSLSEAPENEVPVAKELVNYIISRNDAPIIEGPFKDGKLKYNSIRRKTNQVLNIGGNHSPIVIADLSSNDANCNFGEKDLKPDYIYIGNKKILGNKETASLVNHHEIGIIKEYSPEAENNNNIFFLYNASVVEALEKDEKRLSFLKLNYEQIRDDFKSKGKIYSILKNRNNIVVIGEITNKNIPGQMRAFGDSFDDNGIKIPLVFNVIYNDVDIETMRIKSASDYGAALIDLSIDGIMISNQNIDNQSLVNLVFGILQASRTRITKTEFISCPGCGRTLFDLQSTIAKVKNATSHLTGLKIGIMGCIVNGPGEMADADYGYVGAGRNRISLYKNKECIEKNIPEEEAVDKLIELIKKYGDWKERE